MSPPAEAVGDQPSATTRWPLLCFAVIITFTVGMMLLSFPAGFYTVFGTHLSDNVTASTPVYALDYELFLAVVQVPVVGNLGDLFVACSVVYLAFFLLAAKQGSGLFRALRESVSSGYDALFTNPLAATMLLVGATSLATVLLDTAQTDAGISTGSLTGDPFALLIDFTLAPLQEESSFRLVMIGVPVLVLSIVMLRNFSPMKIARTLWRPSSLWDEDETDETRTARSFENSGPSMFPAQGPDSLKVRAMKPVVYVFLALSSLTFGYAHYASGAGWGPGKISEAALAGLALGYLYIKYGFHTNVLLHWSINYAGTVFSFLAQGLWGIPYTSNSGSLLDVVPTLDLVLFLGVPSTLIIANELLKRLARTTAAPRPTG